MLSPDQERAVALMSAGMKPSAVAAALGVTDRAVRKWRANPEFIAELEEAQEHVRSAARVRLVGLVDEAIDTVQDILKDVGAAPAARLRAAELVLARIGLDELKQMHSVAPQDVERVLAFMRWEQEQSKQQGTGPRSDDGSDPTGTSD